MPYQRISASDFFADSESPIADSESPYMKDES